MYELCSSSKLAIALPCLIKEMVCNVYVHYEALSTVTWVLQVNAVISLIQ